MHHLNAQLGVARQQFFEQQRIAHGAAEFRHGDVGASGAARAHVDGDGDVQFLGEREVGIDRRIAGRKALVLQSDLAHDFEAAAGEVFSQFFERDALAGRHSVSERRAGDDPLGRGVFPLLHALGIAEDNRRDVQALHLGENILHVFARG